MREITEAEVQRIKRFPKLFRNAERKMEMLRREAERYGMHDLLKPEKRA